MVVLGSGETAMTSRGRTIVKHRGKELTMKTLMNRFVKDESGATAIEYGLIAALIAVVIIAALQLLGTNISANFRAIATAIGTGAPAAK
jgi:pilus assembly protein Flp/PilA